MICSERGRSVLRPYSNAFFQVSPDSLFDKQYRWYA